MFVQHCMTYCVPCICTCRLPGVSPNGPAPGQQQPSHLPATRQWAAAPPCSNTTQKANTATHQCCVGPRKPITATWQWQHHMQHARAATFSKGSSRHQEVAAAAGAADGFSCCSSAAARHSCTDTDTLVHRCQLDYLRQDCSGGCNSASTYPQ